MARAAKRQNNLGVISAFACYPFTRLYIQYYHSLFNHGDIVIHSSHQVVVTIRYHVVVTIIHQIVVTIRHQVVVTIRYQDHDSLLDG